jgi:hypothetical protein
VTDLRARFIATFGLDLTETIEAVAEHHTKVMLAVLDRGSDPFRFAIVWAIGFACLTRPGFRLEHGVTAPWADLLGWICDEAGLASFDGTMDLSGRGRGLFDAILGRHNEDDVEAGLRAAEAWLIATAPVGVRGLERRRRLVEWDFERHGLLTSLEQGCTYRTQDPSIARHGV